MTVRLEVGELAPGFSLPDEDGELVSLADFAGRRVVLYFYPADDTPGCTKEACQFNDLLPDFSDLGSEVLGISKNGATSHQAFRAKYGLSFHLLTDADRQVMQAYGAFGEKVSYGKTTMGVIRSTFVVDAEGRIAAAWYNVKADGHAAKVLAALGA